MQQFDNRRILTIKILTESCKDNKIDKNKILDLIDKLITTCPGNAYLLLETKELKQRYDKVYKELNNVESICDIAY